MCVCVVTEPDPAAGKRHAAVDEHLDVASRSGDFVGVDVGVDPDEVEPAIIVEVRW